MSKALAINKASKSLEIVHSNLTNIQSYSFKTLKIIGILKNKIIIVKKVTNSIIFILISF